MEQKLLEDLKYDLTRWISRAKENHRYKSEKAKEAYGNGNLHQFEFLSREANYWQGISDAYQKVLISISED